MWPLTKKASSSNRKGFFGRNSEQRGARLKDSKLWSSKDQVHHFSSRPPLPHCSQIKQVLTYWAELEDKFGPLSGYWCFEPLQPTSSCLGAHQKHPDRWLKRNSWAPPKPMESESPGVGPRNLYFVSSLGSSNASSLQTSIWEPLSHSACFHMRNESQDCCYKT